MSLMDSVSALFDALGFDLSAPDQAYAEELQFQEALAASLNIPAISGSSSSQCCCQNCFGENDKQEMFQIPRCSQLFCSVEEFQYQEVLSASMTSPTTSESASSQICCQNCSDEKDKQEMCQIPDCSHFFCSDEEHQFQEALSASFNSSTTSESSSSQICCQICFDEKDKQEMFQIQGCSHSFCSVCVTNQVKSKLEDNILNISCLSENCKNMIEPGSLKATLPSHILALWEKELSESTILPAEKSYCPYADCREISINDGNEGEIRRQSECPWCWRLFCAYCKVPWHSDLSCEQFKRSKRDRRDKQQLRLLAEVNKWKKCPECRVYVEKTEGCIHITCRCKFEFCYVCGKTWNESHFTTCQT